MKRRTFWLPFAPRCRRFERAAGASASPFFCRWRLVRGQLRAVHRPPLRAHHRSGRFGHIQHGYASGGTRIIRRGERPAPRPGNGAHGRLAGQPGTGCRRLTRSPGPSGLADHEAGPSGHALGAPESVAQLPDHFLGLRVLRDRRRAAGHPSAAPSTCSRSSPSRSSTSSATCRRRLSPPCAWRCWASDDTAPRSPSSGSARSSRWSWWWRTPRASSTRPAGGRPDPGRQPAIAAEPR